MKADALSLVVLALIAGCLALAGQAAAAALAGRQAPLLLAALLWLPLAWGLWRRHPLARRVAVALLWLVVLVLPIGVINPFAAMDGLRDTPLLRLAVPVFGAVAVALWMLHILGKHKAEFGRDDRS